jgi:hypothetical protein
MGQVRIAAAKIAIGRLIGVGSGSPNIHLMSAFEASSVPAVVHETAKR